MTAPARTPRPAPGTAFRAFCDAMSEDDLQTEIMNLAEQNGWMRFHAVPATVWRKGRPVRITHQEGEPGFPDLILARDGVVLPWELKNETNSPDPEQRAWIGHLGGAARVIRPRDLPEVRRILQAPRTGTQGPPIPPPRTGRRRAGTRRGIDEYLAGPRPVRVIDPTA